MSYVSASSAQEGMTLIQARIPTRLHCSFKAAAAQRGMSVRALLQAVIENSGVIENSAGVSASPKLLATKDGALTS